eukprot:7210501-Pyramimonas_sp.AAC.1
MAGGRVARGSTQRTPEHAQEASRRPYAPRGSPRMGLRKKNRGGWGECAVCGENEEKEAWRKDNDT